MTIFSDGNKQFKQSLIFPKFEGEDCLGGGGGHLELPLNTTKNKKVGLHDFSRKVPKKLFYYSKINLTEHIILKKDGKM